MKLPDTVRRQWRTRFGDAAESGARLRTRIALGMRAGDRADYETMLSLARRAEHVERLRLHRRTIERRSRALARKRFTLPGRSGGPTHEQR
jgi:hypothetical protein